MAANRLFYQDAYQTECVTDVTSITREKDHVVVTLKEGLFHAKGGGQPADRGTIDGIALLDVREQDGELLHILPQPPSREKGVVCRLDWEYRYDLMKQHTGQHILSAVLERLFDDTTNISRGEEWIGQIDVQRMLAPQQLEQAQRLANELLREGRAVRGFVVTPQELPAYLPRMRHAVSPHDAIRLVEIEDLDLMGCGGAHVKNTAEVGMIKILAAKNVADQKSARGEMRIYFLCGDRAMADYERKNAAFYELGALFGCEPEALPDKVRELKAQFDRQGARLKEIEERLLSFEVEDLARQTQQRGAHQVARAHLPGRSLKELKAIAEALTKQRPCMALLSSACDDGLPVVLLQPKGYSECNMGEMLKSLLGATGAKGGGPLFAQATLPATQRATEALCDCFDTIQAALEQV